MKEEQESLKKKLKVNKIVIIVLCIILLLVICILVSMKVLKSSNVVANNDSNLGLAIEGENAIFYYSYGKGLVKKENNKETLLTEEQAYYLQYLNHMIYYVTQGSSGEMNIKRITSEGKDEKLLLSTNSKNMKIYLDNSKIYYTTSNPGTISRIDLLGNEEEVILQRDTIDYKVFDDKIYFSDNMGLYSIDKDGGNYKTLSEEAKFDVFQILKEDVYYFDNANNKLMKMNLKDISKKEEVTNKLNCNTFNVTNEGIYYLDKENEKIKYVSLNGKKEKDIAGVNNINTKINVVGDVLYFIDTVNDNTYTKLIGTNGEEVN